MAQFIRVLHGDIGDSSNVKLKRTIEGYFQRFPEQKGFTFCAAGQNNADFLKSLGAQRVIRVTKSPTADPDAQKYYNKIWILSKIMKIFNEIIYTDFDSRPCRILDDNIWDLAHQKTGVVDGALQACTVVYKRPIVVDPLGLRTTRQHFHLCGSTLYCNDYRLMKDWVKLHEELWTLDPTWKGRATDETSIMYMIDKVFGLMDERTLVNNFEPHFCKSLKASAFANDIAKISYFGHK